jgi:hypothetical protein
MNTEIAQELLNFQSITLEEMKDIRLMNRTDTKFITSIYLLPKFLKTAQKYYYVQEIEQMRTMPYGTLYFDTLGRDMYRIHHNGKKNRQKIRVRTYEKTGVSFLEIKNKNNKGKTNKLRIPVNGVKDQHDQNAVQFLSENAVYEVDTLKPHLENSFQRITLVNKAKTERLTIDYGIQFYNHFTDKNADLASLVIVELKREGHAYSPLSVIKREVHISSTSISKYCIGTALTDEEIKKNRFKIKLREIQKLAKTN